jgi:hypothetical protein
VRRERLAGLESTLAAVTAALLRDLRPEQGSPTRRSPTSMP